MMKMVREGYLGQKPSLRFGLVSIIYGAFFSQTKLDARISYAHS